MPLLILIFCGFLLWFYDVPLLWSIGVIVVSIFVMSLYYGLKDIRRIGDEWMKKHRPRLSKICGASEIPAILNLEGNLTLFGFLSVDSLAVLFEGDKSFNGLDITTKRYIIQQLQQRFGLTHIQKEAFLYQSDTISI